MARCFWLRLGLFTARASEYGPSGSHLTNDDTATPACAEDARWAAAASDG